MVSNTPPRNSTYPFPVSYTHLDVYKRQTTYNVGGVEYCTLYYNKQRFNAVYSDVKSGILSSDQLAAYVKTLWSSALGSSLKDVYKRQPQKGAAIQRKRVALRRDQVAQ